MVDVVKKKKKKKKKRKGIWSNFICSNMFFPHNLNLEKNMFEHLSCLKCAPVVALLSISYFVWPQ